MPNNINKQIKDLVQDDLVYFISPHALCRRIEIAFDNQLLSTFKSFD